MLIGHVQSCLFFLWREKTPLAPANAHPVWLPACEASLCEPPDRSCGSFSLLPAAGGAPMGITHDLFGHAACLLFLRWRMSPEVGAARSSVGPWRVVTSATSHAVRSNVHGLGNSANWPLPAEGVYFPLRIRPHFPFPVNLASWIAVAIGYPRFGCISCSRDREEASACLVNRSCPTPACPCPIAGRCTSCWERQLTKPRLLDAIRGGPRGK